MRDHGIRATAPRRFVRTTDSRHGLSAAENVLDRDFDPAEPNAAWASDIPNPDRFEYVEVFDHRRGGGRKRSNPAGEAPAGSIWAAGLTDHPLRSR